MVNRFTAIVGLLLPLLASACARQAAIATMPEATLDDPAGGTKAVRALTGASRFTVVTFWSAHCPCQTAHDARLRDLAAAYASRGVAFVAVDSEVGASAERDRAEAAARAYPFPLLVDRGGALARAVHAQFATYTVLVDDRGTILYRGGIDGDRTHLTDGGPAYLRDALDDALASRPVRVALSEPLGCTLQLR